MRVIYRRIIPTIILILIFVFFFLSDIILGFRIITNSIKNSCIIPQLQEKQCTTKPIKIEGNKYLLIGLSNENPSFKYVVNRSIDDLDKSTSYFSLIGNRESIKGTQNIEQAIISLSIQVELERIPFDDERITLNQIDDNKTSITLNYDKEINHGYQLDTNLYIKDQDGREAFGWQNATTSKSFLQLFVSSYSYLIQYLVWFYALFGKSFKSSIWSTVYNSKTKDPILGAVVRIFRDQALVESFVTGETGVLYTKLPKGRYKLMITHSNFKFPSNLAPMPRDGEYRNLYYGGEVELKKDNQALNINIPLDPVGIEIKTSALRKASTALLSTADSSNPILIIIIASFQIVLWPTYLESWIFAVIGASLLAIQRHQKNRQKKTPGLIMDEQGNKLPNMKINLYDGQWERLVDTKTTNAKGEYEFIVPNARYYLTIEDSQYSIQGADVNGRFLIHPKASTTKTLYINDKLVLTPATTQVNSTSASTSSTAVDNNQVLSL